MSCRQMSSFPPPPPRFCSRRWLNVKPKVKGRRGGEDGQEPPEGNSKHARPNDPGSRSMHVRNQHNSRLSCSSLDIVRFLLDLGLSTDHVEGQGEGRGLDLVRH
eukprot:767706-Hanusia_phi.AAC.5